MKTKITILVAILFSVCSFGQVGTVFTLGGLKYKITAATTVEVAQNADITGAVTIPLTVTYNSANYQVTSIGKSAFQSCTGLTSVTIPNSVTSIGYEAFYYCLGLTTISLPNNLKSIDSRAFYYCLGLTSIILPNSLTSMGSEVFKHCVRITVVTVNWTNPLSISSSTSPFNFLNLSTIALNVPAGTESLYQNAIVWKEFGQIQVILNGAIQIGQNFDFAGINYAVTKATKPYEVAVNGCVSFVGNAFIRERVQNKKYDSFTVTSIRDYVFWNCHELSAIRLPNTLTSIGYGAFQYCKSLKSINIPNSLTNISEALFFYCTGLESVKIPNSIKSIGKDAFYQCTSLKSVYVNWSSPKEIDSSVFSKWDAGTNVLYTSGVKLNVPVGREAAYKAANFWKSFNPIVGQVTEPLLDETFAIDGIIYIVTKATLPYEVAVSSYTSFVGALTIPTNVSIDDNSFEVTSIDSAALVDCTGLVSVIIPDTVTSIRTAAFAGCTGLTSISIPNSVTSIMSQAFQNCTSLTSIIIPNSITKIDMAAFSGCSGLKSVTMPNAVTSIGYGSFYSCTSLTSISIPNTVTIIDNSAFNFCRGLTSITIPASVTIIGDQAFHFCDGLTTVSVNWTTPLSINPNVFEVLTLSKVTLNVPLGTEAAYKVANVWKEFGSIVESAAAPVLGQTFISNAINYIVTKATLPYEVAVGSNTTFVGVALIPDAVSNLGNSFAVTKIANNAFNNCNGLSSITIPNSVTSIGNSAFIDCTGLKAITIPSSIISIGSSAFYRCSGITSVSIPNSVTSIGQEAFSFCTGLTAFDISNSITNIGVLAFSYCSGLTSITIPTSITSIGEGAFYECRGLTSLTIPNSVTSISRIAFGYCVGLTSITIPNSVTSIGENAFYECSGLKSVSVDWQTPLATNTNIFEKVPTTTVILYIPAGTEAAYKAAAVWKDFGTITLGDIDFSSINALKLYPNPTQSQINFSQEINNLEVFDIVGKKVKTFQNLSSNFDVSNLVKGIYFLKGNTTDGTTFNEKLVKE